MTDRKSNRRKFMLTVGAGIASGLAGCADQISEVTGDSDDSENNPTEEQGTPGPPEATEYSSEDSQYVEGGEMTVRPHVGVYDAYYRMGNDIYVTMSAMPSPVENYNIKVHLTPLEETESEWTLRTPTNPFVGGGENIYYDSSSKKWRPDGSDPHRFYERRVAEHGEHFATLEVPSSAAGLVSEDVTNPLKLSDAEYTPEDLRKAESADSPSQEWYRSELRNQMSDIGIDYHPAVKNTTGGPTPVDLFEELGVVGGFPTQDIFPEIPPYVVKFDTSETNFPYHKPFVLTFGIEADKAPDVEPESVVAQTPQMHKSRASSGLIRPQRIPINGSPQSMQNSWGGVTYSPERGETERGLPIPETESYKSEDFRLINTHRRGVLHSGEHRFDRTRVSRISNYSRFSPYLGELIEQWSEYGRDIDNQGSSLHELVSSPAISSPVQNLWSIDYVVTEQQMEDANRAVSDVEPGSFNPEPYEEMVQRSSVKDHPVVEDVAQKLGRVCQNINATHPSDKVRVVADFVQRFPYFEEAGYSDSRTFLGTYGPQHPVWTLFYRAGDCQDFSVLINSILRQDPFDMDPSYGFIEGFGAFSKQVPGHMSSVIPAEDLGVSGYSDSFRYNDRDGINEALGYEKNGSQYLYLESVAPYIIGRTTNAYGTVDVDQSL